MPRLICTRCKQVIIRSADAVAILFRTGERGRPRQKVVCMACACAVMEYTATRPEMAVAEPTN